MMSSLLVALLSLAASAAAISPPPAVAPGQNQLETARLTQPAQRAQEFTLVGEESQFKFSFRQDVCFSHLRLHSIRIQHRHMSSLVLHLGETHPSIAWGTAATLAFAD